MLQRLSRLKRVSGRAQPEPGDYRHPAVDGGWRVWVVVVALLFASALVLTWPWLSGRVTIPWDGKAHFQAQAAFLAQSIQSGQSPFWAPYVFGGHPQIADPQSLIFSPAYMILAWLTPNPTFAMVDGAAFAKLVFGALGILGFARDRRWHPAAAIVAAITFAFAGSAAWRIQHIGQILSLAYFPWSLWMLERALRLSSARYGALAGLFAAMVVLGPDQVAYLVLVALAGYAISHWVSGPGRRERLRASIRPLTAGTLVGSAIILVPTLMVLSFADGSNRAHIGLEEANLGSLHPTSLITFVVSNIFGTIGRGRDFWGAPSIHWPFIIWSNLARNMANFYMGFLPFVAMVLWLSRREAYHRRAAVFAILLAFMLLYALGNYTPLYAAVYHLLPGADLFRRPADSLFLVGAIGALLAGYGLDAALRDPQGRLPRLGVAILGALVVASFATGLGMAVWLDKVAKAWPEMLVAAITIGATLGILALGMKHGRAHPLRVAALFAIALTADLAWNIRPNDSTGLPPELHAELRPDARNETLDFLKAHIVRDGDRRDRVELTGLGFFWPNLGLVHRLENTLGYNPLRLGYYSEAVGARDHVAGWDQRQFSALFPDYHSPLANLLGLRFIATSVPIERINPSVSEDPLPLVARTKESYIYENRDTYPRVMVVPQAVALDQDELIRTGHWPSADFRRIAFVEPSAMPLPQATNPGSARITRYENTRVEIEVMAPEGGVLLLNDVFHPWWFARVDGMPARVLRANGIFRAVVLPRGAKHVAFSFEPVRGLIRRYLLQSGIIGF